MLGKSKRTPDREVGLPRAVHIGRDDRVNAGVWPQQADEAVVVERLAEVHVAATAPRAERGVTGNAHRIEVCQLAGFSSACTWLDARSPDSMAPST